MSELKLQELFDCFKYNMIMINKNLNLKYTIAPLKDRWPNKFSQSLMQTFNCKFRILFSISIVLEFNFFHPNWHERVQFPTPVLFGSDFVS